MSETHSDGEWPTFENKINIYVDSELYGKIIEDAKNFRVFKRNGAINVNEYCNLVIYHYLDEYISLVEKNSEGVLEILKTRFPDDGSLTELAKKIAYLTTNTPNELKKQSDKTLSLLITKDKRDVILEAIARSFPRVDVSRFFRNLLRSFMSLPVYRREQIVYADRIKKINEAIKMREAVRYKHSKNQNWHSFFPAAIDHSKHEYYNYVAGQMDNEYHTTSTIRIANMKDIHKTGRPATFTEDFPMLMERTLRNGIQFAVQEDRLFTVVLSKDGYNNYLNRYLEQPEPIETEHMDDGSVRMTFDCSFFQLKGYFEPFRKQVTGIPEE